MTPITGNAHIHLPPNFSAFETVEQAVSLASKQHLRALGASNYYEYSVYAEFEALCQSAGIFPLFGTEIICMIEELRDAGVKINDPGNPGKMYLCGKGIKRFRPLTPEGASLLETIRSNDSARMAEMTDRLARRFELAGLDGKLTEADVKAMVVARHNSPLETVYLQERHIAQAFQERMFETVPVEDRPDALKRMFGSDSKCAPEDAVGIQNEIRSHLMKAGKPAFVEETFVNFDHAYRLILELGGIPCYPTLADGTKPICEYEADVAKLITESIDRGIYCCELIPVRNSPEQVSRYAEAMREAGLIVTAGTEHNTRDVIPMAPTCAGGSPLPKRASDIFSEGMCVVAAHQSAPIGGGYVDETGAPAGSFHTNDGRIAYLSSVGEELISK